MHGTSKRIGGNTHGPTAGRRSTPTGEFWFALYRGLGQLASAGAHSLRWVASRRAQRERAADLAERLALDAATLELPQGGIWLHAASVGEVRAIASLSDALGERFPKRARFLTVQTRTGRTTACREFDLPVRLAPLDDRAVVRRLLDAARPSLYVVVETEIWPCLLDDLARRGIPAALVSARLSPEKWPRYRRAAALYSRTLSRLTWLSPASEADRDRFLDLGCPAEIIGPTGNLKWDGAPPTIDREKRDRLFEELGAASGRRWVVCGSVHPGEVKALIAALENAGGAGSFLDGSWGLLVAPRHPHRFDEIAAEVEAAGWPQRRLSEGLRADRPVLLVDRLGLLPSLYALGHIAVLGGTLVPIGGHTPLEAAAAACPLVSGPHRAHVDDLLAPLAAAGGAVLADDAPSMASTIKTWIGQEESRRLAGDAALATVNERRGHAARLAVALGDLIA